MTRRDWVACGMVFLLALGLRLHGVTRPPDLFMDEPANVPAAERYWSAGHFEPDLWQHPPFAT